MPRISEEAQEEENDPEGQRQENVEEGVAEERGE